MKNFIFWIYRYSLLIRVTSVAVSFLRDLTNSTVISKPNSFIYHLCQTSSNINGKEIRWQFQAINQSENSSEDLFHDSDCFELYHDVSISVLVVKEPDLFIGKYTCEMSLNESFSLSSTGWMDVKFSTKNSFNEDQTIDHFSLENELSKMAQEHHLPLIIDQRQDNPYGQRVEHGGTFHSECHSINSSQAIKFIWLHFSATSRTVRILRHGDDLQRIQLDEQEFSSSLFIYSVQPSDQGDYVCIASNRFGHSYSSRRTLIVSERMILPRIRTNFGNFTYLHVENQTRNELICYADGYPIPEVRWIRAIDSVLLSENRSFAVLKFDQELHGMHEYVCQARNKHGSMALIIYAIIPNFNVKPWIIATDVQARHIRLQWYLSADDLERWNHFIIYYRLVDHPADEELDRIDNYQQILLDLRMRHFHFIHQVDELIPFTDYEFRIRAFSDATPSDYSNPLFVRTLETWPEKVRNLQGYRWNRSAVVIHWTPVSSSNGENFYYLLYYTNNTLLPFDQWSNKTIRTDPFVILTFPMSNHWPLFIRVATVNNKGFTLTDLTFIHRDLSSHSILYSIENFRCKQNNDSNVHQMTLSWSIIDPFKLKIEQFLLYYTDMTDVVRQFPIPMDLIKREKQFTFSLNLSSFDPKFNQYHLLRLYLTAMDRQKNQHFVNSSIIHCLLPRRYGKRRKKRTVELFC